MTVIPDPTKIVEKVADSLDDNLESEQERQQTLTDRLQIDSTSPFRLPHLIRPIITLTLLVFQLLILVGMFFGVEIPEHIVWEIGGLNAVAIGFYFNSRKAEKINAKRTAVALEIKKNEAKEERRRSRDERREARRDARHARRNDDDVSNG